MGGSHPGNNDLTVIAVNLCVQKKNGFERRVPTVWPVPNVLLDVAMPGRTIVIDRIYNALQISSNNDSHYYKEFPYRESYESLY